MKSKHPKIKTPVQKIKPMMVREYAKYFEKVSDTNKMSKTGNGDASSPPRGGRGGLLATRLTFGTPTKQTNKPNTRLDADPIGNLGSCHMTTKTAKMDRTLRDPPMRDTAGCHMTPHNNNGDRRPSLEK
jgi:hypothetical protein